MPESRCLAPHLIRNRPVRIHLHDDDTWWFWQDDGTIEQGPFDSQELAQEAYQTFSEQEKPAFGSLWSSYGGWNSEAQKTPLNIKWILICILAVLVYSFLPTHC